MDPGARAVKLKVTLLLLATVTVDDFVILRFVPPSAGSIKVGNDVPDLGCSGLHLVVVSGVGGYCPTLD